MNGPEKQRANGLTQIDLDERAKKYNNSTGAEKRALEIQDLGYPLTDTDAETETLARTVPKNRYYVPE